MNEEIIIPAGWTAFIKDKACLGYRNFPNGGKYYGVLSIVSEESEEKLKTKLEKQGIRLPS